MRFSISDASRLIAGGAPERADATMHLGDADLMELQGARELTDATARLYADVVLRGAVLAGGQERKQTLLPEAPLPVDATMHLGDGDLLQLAAPGLLPDVTARLYRSVSLRGASIPGRASRSSWLDGLPEREEEAAPDPLGVTRPSVTGRVSQLVRRGAETARQLFEPGRVAPSRLAAGAFVAGFLAASLIALVL